MAHKNNDETKKIPLGSGKIYVMEYTGTIPTDSTFETEDNLFGHIQGGASIEYKPSYYTAKDDLNLVSKKVLTDEEATLKLGIITWNNNTLNKLISSGTVTEDTKTGRRTLKIGGLQNQDVKQYVFRFVNSDAVDGDTRITIVGGNENGVLLSYTKDKEAIINPEIKAVPMVDGTLIIIDEEILSASPAVASVTSVTSGASTGK